MLKYTRMDDFNRPSVVTAVKKMLVDGSSSNDREKIAFMEKRLQAAEEETYAINSSFAETQRRMILLKE